MNIFHLAIPTHDLDAATSFYTEALSAKPARRYHDRQTFNFFGHQLVCHLDEDLVPDPDPLRTPYPRHFGLTVLERRDIERAHWTCADRGVRHLSNLVWRFPEKPERHLTFWAADPSGNVLEFKWYEDYQYVY
jgi:extradiol dioxygenase family protein